MSIRTRNIHFTNWAKVIEALADKGVTVADESAARTFLTETSSDANPYYYYVGYIKDTQEIYTHGKFYSCSDSSYDDTELRDLIGTKADLSALEALVSEVEENELVTTKALYDLNDRKLDRSELDNIDLSNYVDVGTYNSDLDSINASITSKANQSDLAALSAEVEENEEVTAAALTELHENKADKSEIPDVSAFATKDELNTLSAEVDNKVDSATFTTLSETVAGHTTSIDNLSNNKADKTDLDDYAKQNDLNTKQDLLVSGTNIKTVNSNSILGSGNIETPDTKVTSAANHYGYNSNNATSTTGAFVTKITKDAANHVTYFESRALTATDIPGLDASKITSGTISIERLPAGALERMFVVESETAAMSATVQEGDVVQVTGNNNKMYFCISNTATTFATKFKEFTAGTATSVAWSGITGKPDLATQEELDVVDAKFDNYFLASNFTKANIKSTLGISDWALASGVPTIKKEYLTNLDSATSWTAFYSSYQPSNRPNSGGNYLNGITLGSDIVGGNYLVQLGLNYFGTPFTRYLFDSVWSDWKQIAFTTDIPTKLSQLTDDVVAGKYLPLSGGTINGSITATSFVGNLTGNVTGNVSGSSGFCTGNAASATAVRINNAASNVLCPLIFVSNTTAGNKTLFVSTGKSLTFNPSTGDLKATTFTGDLVGNAASTNRFRCVLVNANQGDLNSILEGGAIAYNYYAVNAWINGPTGAKYGSCIEFTSNNNNTSSLAGQLLWDINNGSTDDTTRFLWWRAADSNGWVNSKWHQIAFTDSNVDSATTATKVTVGTGSSDSYRAIVVTNGSNGLYTAGTDTGKPRYNYSTGDVKAASFTTDGGNFVGNLIGTASGNLPLSGGTLTGAVTSTSTFSATDFITTSDNRLKDFVSDIHVDFESLKQIPKKYYYWKDKSMGEELQIGTSAQELAKVYPECVHYDETNDRYSVNYQKLSIVALAAIDKLHDRISELESKLYD